MKLTENTKQELTIAFILFLLSCVLFWKVLLNHGKIIFAEYFSDVISQFSPYKFFISTSFKEYHKFPLWNPYNYMGHPFIGNPLTAMFYPLNFLYLIIPSDALFGFHFLFDVFLIGLFTYLFARVLNTDRFGSIVSAVTFMFSGLVISRIYAGHIPNLDVVTLTPLTFLLLELSIKKRNIFYGILTGIPLGLQFLAGHIEFALYSSFGLVLYFLCRLFFIFRNEKTPRILFKPILILLLTFTVAISLSAIQTIPSFELSKYFTRSEKVSFEYSTSYSFPPEQLITFAMPEFFGTFLDETYWGDRNFWELTVYIGILPLILAFIGILFKRNEYTITFAFLALFSLIFAFGKYSPLFYLFYKIVPIFSMFRMPTVFLFISIFSLSMLSGFGASFLTKEISSADKRKFWRLNKILIILAILTILTLALVFFEKEALLSIGKELLFKKYQTFTETVHPLRYSLDFYVNKIPYAYSHILQSLLVLSIFLISSSILLYLRIKEKIGVNQFRILLLLIIVLDLWLFGMKYIDVKDTNEVFAERISAELFKTEGKFRVFDATDSLPQFISMRNKIEMLEGYDPVQLKSYRDFITFFFGESTWEIEPFISIKIEKIISNPKVFVLLNVKYILTETPIKSDSFILKSKTETPVYEVYKSTQQTKTVYLYENRDVLPRAFVVPNAKIIDNESEILQEMNSSRFNPKEYVILEKNVDTPLLNHGEFKEAKISYYSPNEIHVKLNLSAPGFLVLSENWYPGWKAYDNDMEKEIYKTDYILRSIYLESGSHEIKFVYNPLSFGLGLWITIATTFCICGLVIYKIKKR